jgi:hypothetical protein
MDDRAPSAPDLAILDANIAALELFLPKSAERLREAKPPASVRAAAGRDGCPTFVWSGDAGHLCWLGRTSTPSISSPALVDAFQPGNRNVLLVGLGQGAEARLLLDQLARHQAVIVVEENAWAAALSLRLYDFSDDFRRRRLAIFVGSDAWNALQEFLLSSDGYLTPERVLSWPWFDAKAIAEASSRLLEINRRAAQHRTAAHNERRQSRITTGVPPRSRSIALLSNIPQASVRHLADRLSAGVESLNRPCVRFTLDDPTMVHPFAVERALFETSPDILILLDAAPGALQYQLPPAPSIVLCAHRQALADKWVCELPQAVKVSVPTATQRRQIIDLGLNESRALLLPPAALPGLEQRERQGGRRILVLADGADISAEAVGLHLASHCQLWEASMAMVRENCDFYRDDQAAGILDSAERKLKIRLDSEEVRAGIVDRIRRILGPAVVREAYCMALAEADIDFDLLGHSWGGNPTLAKFHRGPWPEPPHMRRILDGHGMVVSIEPSGCVRSAVLDALSARVAAAVRVHPSDGTGDGLSAVLDPEKHISRFQSRSELVTLAREFAQEPDDFHAQAAAAAAHILAGHTWTHRLQSILQICGVG